MNTTGRFWTTELNSVKMQKSHSPLFDSKTGIMACYFFLNQAGNASLSPNEWCFVLCMWLGTVEWCNTKKRLPCGTSSFITVTEEFNWTELKLVLQKPAISHTIPMCRPLVTHMQTAVPHAQIHMCHTYIARTRLVSLVPRFGGYGHHLLQNENSFISMLDGNWSSTAVECRVCQKLKMYTDRKTYTFSLLNTIIFILWLSHSYSFCEHVLPDIHTWSDVPVELIFAISTWLSSSRWDFSSAMALLVGSKEKDGAKATLVKSS